MHNKRVGEPSQFIDRVETLQLSIVQMTDYVDWRRLQRTVDGCSLPKPSIIAASEWTVNLAVVPAVNMPSFGDLFNRCVIERRCCVALPSK